MRREVRRQTWWTRAAAIATVAAAIVTIALQFRPSDSPSALVKSRGILVTVVAGIGGKPIFAVAGFGDLVTYLRDGTLLYVDCLQLIQPKYVAAEISGGDFANRWIDAFSLRTPRGEDIRLLRPPLPFCGPPLPLVTTTTLPS